MNYDERRAALVEYLKAKTHEGDWHAVSDAANDLRVMEAAGPSKVEPLSKAEAFKGSPCRHGFDWNKGFWCLDCARGR